MKSRVSTDGGQAAAREVLDAQPGRQSALGLVGKRQGRFAVGGQRRRVGCGRGREVDVGHAKTLGFEDSGADMVHGELTGRL